MDAATLYDDDFYAWSEQQAAVLRRLYGRPDLPNDLDLEHVVEEVEDLGKSELRTVCSLLRQAFIHLMKLHVLAAHESARHWKGETREFLEQAADRCSRSMVRHIDLDELWRRALKSAHEELEEMGISVSEETEFTSRGLQGCPFDIESLLFDRSSIDHLLSMLRDCP